MSWRGLCISSPARLDLRAGRLLLRREGEEDVALPLEDLGFVVIDTPQVRLSAAQGCLLLTVDARHMPCAAVLPLAPYYRQLSTLQAQAGLGEVRKKRLWQACVRAKIGNQAACLRLLGRDGAERVACGPKWAAATRTMWKPRPPACTGAACSATSGVTRTPRTGATAC